MNSVCLLGRLTAEPELRTTTSGLSVCSFTVAVDRSFQAQGQERQADFIPCVAWRQRAEFITRYFHKGNRIALQGSLQSRQYTDKEGNKRTAYEVQVDNVFFAESKSGGASQSYESQAPRFNEAPPAFTTATASDFEEIVGDDELPF